MSVIRAIKEAFASTLHDYHDDAPTPGIVVQQNADSNWEVHEGSEEKEKRGFCEGRLLEACENFADRIIR